MDRTADLSPDYIFGLPHIQTCSTKNYLCDFLATCQVFTRIHIPVLYGTEILKMVEHGSESSPKLDPN